MLNSNTINFTNNTPITNLTINHNDGGHLSSIFLCIGDCRVDWNTCTGKWLAFKETTLCGLFHDDCVAYFTPNGEPFDGEEVILSDEVVNVLNHYFLRGKF